MLAELFASKTRVKLLKLFLNPQVNCYPRELSKEFSTSPNAIKSELDNLTKVGYLLKEQNGRAINFCANSEHPFFPEISSIARKTLGMDSPIEDILTDLGEVEHVYIVDHYALGKDSGLIDLLIVRDLDRTKLEQLRQVAEKK